MSKSAGNFLTVHELLREFPGRGEALRLVLLSSHYRQSLDYTRDRMIQAMQILDGFYDIILRAGIEIENPATVSVQAVTDALADDINTPLAITRLHEISSAATRATSHEARIQATADLRASGQLLGLLNLHPDVWHGETEADDGIEQMVLERTAARQRRDFAAADIIRMAILGKGFVLEDGPGGTSWRRAT